MFGQNLPQIVIYIDEIFLRIIVLPSVLLCCWLGGRKGIWPVKKLSGEVVAWLSA